jgi:predicted acyltransferase
VDPDALAPAPAAVSKPRLLSLDVFRGFNILVMIVVNCCGPGSFAQLQHSAWNGCTLTDLVFPFFLFISGVSIAFSSRLQSPEAATNAARLRPLPSILRRAALIFLIGLLINAFPYYHLATWRIPGVLQRIAICYLFGSLLYLFCSARTRWVVIAALLIGYWILMRYVPVPGFGVPGVDIPLLDPDRNLAAWLDRKLMMGHLYEKVRDPEGLLSTLPALANTLFGIAVGEWIRELRSQTPCLDRSGAPCLLRRLLWLGTACTTAGLLWGLAFPINKKLWTSSYVLFTAGLAMITLAACYWLLDVKQLRGRWTVVPLVFGTNCIFAYALSEFLAITLVVAKVHIGGELMNYKNAFNHYSFDHIPWPQWSSLGYALFYTALCWAITWLLYRRRIFLKV